MFKIASPVMFSFYSNYLCGLKYRFSRNQSKSNIYFLLSTQIRRLKTYFTFNRKKPPISRGAAAPYLLPNRADVGKVTNSGRGGGVL